MIMKIVNNIYEKMLNMQINSEQTFIIVNNIPTQKQMENMEN